MSRISLREIVIYGLVAILGIVMLGYFLYQARLLLLGPQLTLENDPTVVQHEKVVPLIGSARNITRITLNGRPIFTNPDGYFEEALVLENGYTVATIRAQDRYGRTTEITREFVYVPASLIEYN